MEANNKYPDMVSRVRQGAEGISPKTREEVLNDLNFDHRSFLEKFGRFIKRPLSEEEIRKRVVFLKSSDDLELFIDAWQPEGGMDYRNIKDISVASLKLSKDWKGKCIVVVEDFDFWERLASSSKEERIGSICFWDYVANPFEPYPEAKEVEPSERERFNYIMRRSFFMHDIVHQYQNMSLPAWFVEAGAYYYQFHCNQGGLTPEDIGQQKTINFFQSLVDKYGDGVHRLSFGLPVSRLRKIQILTEIYAFYQNKGILEGYNT
jgi:hypothetical protein